MKIPDNLNGINGAGIGGAERARGAEQTQQPGSGRTAERRGDADEVQLSGLSRAVRLTTEDTPERLEKVQQLHDAVQSGQYQPDSQEVSNKLIDEALKSRGGL